MNFLNLFLGYKFHVLDCQNNSICNLFWPHSVLLPPDQAPETPNKLSIMGAWICCKYNTDHSQILKLLVGYPLLSCYVILSVH